jgi:uncharacterized membrane protein YphA (DoxX/SURF4 family)
MEPESATIRWSLPARIAFRFVFSYFALFYSGFLGFVMPDRWLLKYYELWREAVVWVGPRLLGAAFKTIPGEMGISNTPLGWTWCLCYLATAAAAAVIWSVLDRKRANYERLHAWLRLALRFALAAAMIRYGAIKVIPTQMISPPLGVLGSPVGNLEPNYLLWWFVGSSPAYETFTGLAELVGGLLLLTPRTTLVGALMSAANMLTVFLLNMCYDVIVKLYSFHLLIIALILVAPHLRRLADLLLFNRRVERARETPLFARPWLDRIPQALVFFYGLYLVGSNFAYAVERWEGRNDPKSPLHGIWSVETYAVDGREMPMFQDPERWRWVTFGRPGEMSVERMIGSKLPLSVDLRMAEKTILLRTPGGEGKLSFVRPDANVLLLDGTVDGHRTQAKLRKMALLGPRFHWVRDPEPMPEGGR